MSPLERLIGFQFSEDIYDQLDLTEQIILDLLIEGWQQNEIADLLCVHKSWINRKLHGIRAYLGDTELKRHLQLRMEMKNGEHLR